MRMDQAVSIAKRLREGVRVYSITYRPVHREWVIQYEDPEDGACGDTLEAALYEAGWDGIYEESYESEPVGKEMYDEFWMIEAQKGKRKWTADERADYPFLSLEMAENHIKNWSKEHPDIDYKPVKFMRIEEKQRVQ